MARYGKERRGETRQRIVETASQRFRAEGVDGVGIASLMSDAGLTNGAFYAHFDSKEDLVREAIATALATVPTDLGLCDESTTSDLRGFIEAYLSCDHRKGVASGCAMAALVSDLSRRPSDTRRAFQQGGIVMINRIAAALPEPIEPAERVPRAFSVFALLLGTLQMARFVPEGAMSRALLSRGRDDALSLAGFTEA